MSHVGLGNQLQQPNKRCLKGKYWQPATKTLMESIGGHCRVGCSMSHVGLGNQLQQPNKRCLKGKYWQPATKTLIASIGGHCKAGYCKKDEIHKQSK